MKTVRENIDIIEDELWQNRITRDNLETDMTAYGKSGYIAICNEIEFLEALKTRLESQERAETIDELKSSMKE